MKGINWIKTDAGVEPEGSGVPLRESSLVPSSSPTFPFAIPTVPKIKTESGIYMTCDKIPSRTSFLFSFCLQAPPVQWR